MRRRIVWLASLVACVSSVSVLLVALTFLPVEARGRFAAVAALATIASVAGAAALASVASDGLLRPLRHMLRALESEPFAPGAPAAVELRLPEEVAPLFSALRRTRERLSETLGQIERDRAQVATIFEHMADGVLVLDSEERVQISNPAAARLLGNVVPAGARLAEVARDVDVVQIARSAELPTSAPVVQVVEIRPRPGGPRRWLQVVATRLPDEVGRTLVLLQDVTDLRRAEVARRDFVANVSHELRTPLASLKALAETLELGALDDPEAAREFLRRMHFEVDGLAHFVSELLELARVEAGKTSLELAPRSAAVLLREAVDRMRPYAERSGLQVAVRVAPDAAEMDVLADRARVGQVLANLLSNAVKFTPPGGVIEAGVRGRDGSAAEFWVVDSGVGINPENLTRVFERFYKTDPSRAGAGTGLGLAICKHLVLAHGGTIWAESRGEGRGAAIRFTLPLARAAGSSGASSARVLAGERAPSAQSAA